MKQHLKVPTRPRYCEKIGKFKIGVNLVKDPMEIMKIRAFSKCWYKKTRACLYFIFSRFQTIFYLDLHFLSISSTRAKKAMQRFVLSYHQFFLPYLTFQKVITSRVYKFSGCERNLLKEPFFQFVILKNSQLINCISSLSRFFLRFQVICNNIP